MGAKVTRLFSSRDCRPLWLGETWGFLKASHFPFFFTLDKSAFEMTMLNSCLSIKVTLVCFRGDIAYVRVMQGRRHLSQRNGRLHGIFDLWIRVAMSTCQECGLRRLGSKPPFRCSTVSLTEEDY